MTVEINDVKHLQKVMKSIKKIDGVLEYRARGPLNYVAVSRAVNFR